MRKVIAMWFVVVMLALWGGVRLAQAQEDQEEQAPQEEQGQTKAKPAKPAAPESKPKAEQSEKPVHAYRLDFSFNELQDGKKVNTRHYSMNLNAGDHQQLRIGTRVPVATGSFQPVTDGKETNPSFNTQFEYMDVGTRIDARTKDHGDELELWVNSETSNLDTESRRAQGLASNPMVRHMEINGSTVVVPGKPVVIGSVDDPNSNRQFQLEVTATRLK